jgi:antitoxin (DNA-binding transcriptional repressor) of toxin-antitoxin stability system
LTVSTISINDLKKQPIGQWLQSGSTGDLVVTAQGEPAAVLLPVQAENLESTLSVLRSVRAVQALTALQQTAADNGTCELSKKDTDAEIEAARQNRHRK